MVLGTEMKWKEVRGKSLKDWGGRMIIWLQDASGIFWNGHVKGAQKVKTQGFTSFLPKCSENWGFNEIEGKEGFFIWYIIDKNLFHVFQIHLHYFRK